MKRVTKSEKEQRSRETLHDTCMAVFHDSFFCSLLFLLLFFLLFFLLFVCLFTFTLWSHRSLGSASCEAWASRKRTTCWLVLFSPFYSYRTNSSIGKNGKREGRRSIFTVPLGFSRLEKRYWYLSRKRFDVPFSRCCRVTAHVLFTKT